MYVLIQKQEFVTESNLSMIVNVTIFDKENQNVQLNTSQSRMSYIV